MLFSHMGSFQDQHCKGLEFGFANSMVDILWIFRINNACFEAVVVTNTIPQVKCSGVIHKKVQNNLI